MANNVHQYGLRYFCSANGAKTPNVYWRPVADAYQGTVDGGGSNVGISIGDPVKLVSDGSVALALTTNAIFGVVADIRPFWNATMGVLTYGDYIPGATTSGGVFQNRTRVGIIPVSEGIWELDVDENTTATTEAAYEAFVGENVTMVCTGDLNASKPRLDPRIDISVHATTNTLVWRIFGVSPSQANQDFSGTNVKLLLKINISQDLQAGSATGV